ncbi:MAG: CotH kinase family protein [Lachnospiraceae bacterium]|nr:CotH kinase family protein [Lachnospiraceae bacterium]
MKKIIFASIVAFTVIGAAACSNEIKNSADVTVTPEVTNLPELAKESPEATGIPKVTSTPKPTSAPKPTATPKSEKTTVSKYKSSSVPRIELVTADRRGVTTRDEWKKGVLKISFYSESEKTYVLDEEIECEYKGRGNSTWAYSKKPFNVKFEEKVSLLGMEKGKRYSFIANWLDRSAMRNYVTYNIADLFTGKNYDLKDRKKANYTGAGWMWSPDAEYAELYIDGKYAGLYLLTESIKIGDNRLDLVKQDKENPISIENRGLLFELSIDGANFWTEEYIDRIINSRGRLPYNVKEPDFWEDLTEDERNWAKDYIGKVEDIIFAKPSKTAWEKICETIDITSFADYWIVQAIAGNAEPEHPKSVFMYKNNDDPGLEAANADKNNGKLYAGPAWDFDWDTYNKKHVLSKFPTETVYYSALFEYGEFCDLVKKRWEFVKPRLENEIIPLVDKMADELSAAVSNDDSLYPWRRRSGNNVNYDSGYSFSVSAENMKVYLKKRIDVIDGQIKDLKGRSF